MPSQRLDMTPRTLAQVRQTRVQEPRPDAQLPRAVVALNRGLEARFAGRHEHRHYLQAQAQSADPPDQVGVSMRALEDRVVVELGVARQAKLLPESDQGVADQRGRHASLLGPGSDQPAMQRNAIEDLDQRAVLDLEPLDGIEAVQLLLAGGDLGQIPAQRRRLAAYAFASVQGTASRQDTTDGSHRRQRRGLPLLQGVPYGLGAEEAEVAVPPQFLTQLQDEILKGGFGTLRVVRRMRPIGPIDTVQALAGGVANPVQDGGGTDTEVEGHAPQRLPLANGRYHRATPLGLTVCLLMRTSGGVGTVYLNGSSRCSASRDTQVFSIYWHLAAESKWQPGVAGATRSSCCCASGIALTVR